MVYEILFNWRTESFDSNISSLTLAAITKDLSVLKVFPENFVLATETPLCDSVLGSSANKSW